MAPAPDVDLPVVAGHAVAATRRRLLTDLALTVVLLVALLSATAKAVAVVFGLVAAVATWRTVRDLRRRDTGAALYHGLVAVIAWLLCLGPVLVRSVEDWFGGRQPYAPAGLTGVQFVAVLVLVLWAVLFASRVAAQRGVARALLGQPAGPSAGLLGSRLELLSQAAGGNLTVYSPQAVPGPFVGYGAPAAAWSMTVPLRAADRVDLDGAGAAGPLAVTDLYREVRAAWERLAAPVAVGRPLTGLVVEERVHASGMLPAGHPLLDRGVPVPAVPAGIVQDVAAGDRGTERYTLGAWLARPDAGAVLGCFSYLSLVGGLLFVEFVQTSVPAVRADFRRTAGLADGGAGAVLAALAGALADVVTVAPLAPVETGRRLLALLRDATARPLADRSARVAGRLDHGAVAGLRELGAEPGHRVVDELDLNEYARILERSLLDALAGAVAARGYDASALAADPGGPAGRTVLRLRHEPETEPLRPL